MRSQQVILLQDPISKDKTQCPVGFWTHSSGTKSSKLHGFAPRSMHIGPWMIDNRLTYEGRV